MTEDLFLTSLSGASARQAVVEETRSSAWLFMTAPEGEDPVAVCFLYNTGEAPQGDEALPPLPPDLATSYKVKMPVSDDDLQIVWSLKGDAVAVRIRGEYAGFIAPGDLRGYSRSVNQDCEWAHPFDAELFQELFATP